MLTRPGAAVEAISADPPPIAFPGFAHPETRIMAAIAKSRAHLSGWWPEGGTIAPVFPSRCKVPIAGPCDPSKPEQE
jgi:hypothetical protein